MLRLGSTFREKCKKKKEGNANLLFFVKLKVYKQELSHLFLPLMYLTTDFKKHPHPSWAYVRHLFLATQSDISFAHGHMALHRK